MSFLNSSVSLAAILQRCILVATAIAFLPLAAFAKAIVVPSLPVSQYADTEVTMRLTKTVSTWLYRPEWNLMRIARRGVCFPSQSVSYDVKYAQLYIIVR